MNTRYFYSLTYIFLIFFVLVLFTPSFVQSADQTTADDNFRDEKYDPNKKAVEKLGKMKPAEIEALDSKIAEALTLYYDGQYGQALPIFNQIASTVETMDVMWWVGTSAMKTGNMELAIRKFKSMLEVNPNLHRVRLELAATYFQMQRYEESKKELEAVKAARPPETVLKNVDKLLVAIAEATKTVVWNVRFSQGIMYDTNISAGPNDKDIPVSGGTITLTDLQKKLSDYASITNFSGNVLYNISKEKGLMWNSTLDVYNSAYFQYGKFNYFYTDINTGLWWAGRQDILKVPIGYSYQEFGSERLSDIVHFDPSYEHFFSSNFSLKGSYRYAQEQFYDTSNESLDNITRRYEITPSFYFVNRKHIVSLSAALENSSADARQFSYDGQFYAISYFTRFPTQTEIFLRYQWSAKEYKEIPPLFSSYRYDRRNTLTAVINQNFCKNFFASFAFNYIDNYSSAALYDFSKETYTLSIGAYF